MNLGPPWNPNDFSPWVGVVDQAPTVSSTNAFRLEHQLAAKPAAVSSRQVTLEPGDVAPDCTLDGTRGSRVKLAELRGRRVLLRLTRAVSAAII
jgi:hypothetical protein